MKVQVKKTGEVIDVTPNIVNGKTVSYNRPLTDTLRVYLPEEVEVFMPEEVEVIAE